MFIGGLSWDTTDGIVFSALHFILDQLTELCLRAFVLYIKRGP